MTNGLLGFLLALLAAYGVFLLYTSVVFGWRGVGISPGIGRRRRRTPLSDLLVQAGLERVRVVEFVAVEIVLFAVAAAFGYASTAASSRRCRPGGGCHDPDRQCPQPPACPSGVGPGGLATDDRGDPAPGGHPRALDPPGAVLRRVEAVRRRCDRPSPPRSASG
jgi:hypothetical protein